MFLLTPAIAAERRPGARLFLPRTCSRLGRVTAIGLWGIAAESPAETAVIGPDGTAVSYADLAREADRYGRGLRALGLGAGDTVATLLPNGVAALAMYFAAIETGLYVVPVNWHLAAAEVAYILGDSAAGAFVAHERFAGTAGEAAGRAGIKHRFVAGRAGSMPGFEPLGRLGDDGSQERPYPRTHGAPMLYTSGTSGRPKGVRRPLTGADPDDAAVTAAWFFHLFGLAPFDGHVHLCGSPLYHTAVLNFAAISVQLGHPVVLMDGWDPEEALRLIERHRVTHTHAVPTQFRRLLALPDAARGDPQRGAVPAGDQAADDRLAGAGHRRVLRGDRGRRDAHHVGAVAAQAGVGRPALAWLPGARARPGRPGGGPRPAGPGLHADGHVELRLPQRRGEDAGGAVGRPVHRRGHRLPGRGRLPVPVRPRQRRDHHRRGERLPG